MVEKVRNEFEYKDGNLIRLVDGKVIGIKVYRTDTISYKNYKFIDSSGKEKIVYLHRMIYMYHYGEIPKGTVIDHIDGNGLNNNIENLQCISQSENLLKAKLEKTNVTGYKNISYDRNTRKKYRPYISINGKRKYGTRCETLDEAIQVRDSLIKKYR